MILGGAAIGASPIAAREGGTAAAPPSTIVVPRAVVVGAGIYV